MRDTIERERVIDAVKALGLDPNRVRTLTINSDGLDIVQFHMDEDGRRRIAPNGEGYLTVVRKVAFADQVVDGDD